MSRANMDDEMSTTKSIVKQPNVEGKLRNKKSPLAHYLSNMLYLMLIMNIFLLQLLVLSQIEIEFKLDLIESIYLKRNHDYSRYFKFKYCAGLIQRVNTEFIMEIHNGAIENLMIFKETNTYQTCFFRV